MPGQPITDRGPAYPGCHWYLAENTTTPWVAQTGLPGAGSEFAWDTTGQEEAYIWGAWFANGSKSGSKSGGSGHVGGGSGKGHGGKEHGAKKETGDREARGRAAATKEESAAAKLAESALAQILAYTPLVPNWAWHGSAYGMGDFSNNGYYRFWGGNERVLQRGGTVTRRPSWDEARSGHHQLIGLLGEGGRLPSSPVPLPSSPALLRSTTQALPLGPQRDPDHRGLPGRSVRPLPAPPRRRLDRRRPRQHRRDRRQRDGLPCKPRTRKGAASWQLATTAGRSCDRFHRKLAAALVDLLLLPLADPFAAAPR